ncbi:Holliday junction branch migration protein RuvA [Ligilactobacillus ceti]|uniref:Holliday junction branch migration complex subunit RuvA n=1 Tax=Ligilactobacillus ceti DSM 22408 TaxID=1122146 RepID=A0A0R2KN44_9LACO|nr:Holliday junction branch migration protein RuvA [Ligilactobacillus ceti]KRN89046.1 holliday junction dna helicase ruva [Ligilactobacillus ceti DSM 22408]
MYEYFTGVITKVTPYYIVVEVNGIGYQVYVANPFRYQESTTDIKTIYIYQAVRDNAITLFGFYDMLEKQLFLKLLSVSGIGPKSALAILANEDHQGLVGAINADDVGYLVKFPGIGKKTAQQIILDLKGKLDEVQASQTLLGQQGLDLNLTASSPYLQECSEALLALGYTKTEVKKIAKKLTDFNGKSTDEFLRQALKLVMLK